MAVSTIKRIRSAYASLTSSHDLNNITSDGNYWCSSVANAPATYGYLEVHRFTESAAVVLQKFYVHDTGGVTRVFYRVYNNDKWYPWRKIETTAVS